MAISLPQVLDTPEFYQAGAEALAAGRGPFAVDTERASGFRYDDRVFLLQINRRSAGTFLFAPEGHRQELTAALAPVIGGQSWVVHAAVTDLPPLSWLGLRPGQLFDTEHAGRLAGFDRVNLAALVKEATGTEMAKGHGWEDWSTVPLPTEWLDYAAEDVAHLFDLADFLVELLDREGKLGWAEEEFAHIVRTCSYDTHERSWEDTKGLNLLRKPRQLAVARELWRAREKLALRNDVNPARLLPDKAIIAWSKALTADPRDLAQALSLKPGQARRAHQHHTVWREAINTGLSTPRQERPQPTQPKKSIPPRRKWPDRYPRAAEALTRINRMIAELSVELCVPRENLIGPRLLRAAIWESTEGESITGADELRKYFSANGARKWQVDLVTPLFHRTLWSAARR